LGLNRLVSDMSKFGPNIARPTPKTIAVCRTAYAVWWQMNYLGRRRRGQKRREARAGTN